MNKTFKDFILEDLDVFFNDEEMADEHELQGETLVIVVVDSQSNNDITGFPNVQMYSSQEVYKQYKTVYVKASEFHIPRIDSIITLDGEEYYVEDANDEKGIIRIVLSLNES